MGLVNDMAKAAKLRRSDINETIRRIQMKTREVDPGSEEFRRLRVDLEQELKNKKLVKEMRFGGVRLDTALCIATVFVLAGFGFALDMDSPKALKIAQFVLNTPLVRNMLKLGA